MMTEEKPDKKNEGKPEGAVEVDEKDLDKAEGGISSYSVPTDSFSLNFTKTATDQQQKVAPLAAGPGAGPHVAPSDPTKTG